MIEIKNITKKFGNKVVLDDISIEIPEGQKIAIIGPSGCGKSTLLRLMIKLEEPTSGNIYIENQNIKFLSGDNLLKFRRKIGLVFQSSALFDSLTVGENVGFGLREQTWLKKDEINKIIKEKLKMVELDSAENLMPAELSGGMQKRVSLARAIAFNPKIILYDEPTTGLDPIISATIEKLINKLAKELKITTIIVTHQLSTIFRCADRIVMLIDGKNHELGNAEEARQTKIKSAYDFLQAGLV